MSGALVFVNANQGILYNCLALVGTAACVPGSCRIRTIRDSSWTATTPRALDRQMGRIIRYTPSLSVKEAYLLLLGLHEA